MKIAFYMPFKPMGHKNPSGDLVIGTELFQFLEKKSARVQLVSRFRCRWIYLKPYVWPLLAAELIRVIIHCRRVKPDVWFSYHSYYKAPDVIGYLCCRILNIPYVIFQGIYSTKRRKVLKTLPGFLLNRKVLILADCVFNNKRPDEKNLRRLLPKDRVCYIPPGLHPHEFQFSEPSRKRMRRQWLVENKVVVMAAAMFRPGVKTDGIKQVIESCRVLLEKGRDIFLIVIGDGVNRQMLEERAEAELDGACKFVGKIARTEMQNFYSGADIFAFPGIQESLGMVYLEAQSCGLPVIAYKDWGASEAVVDGITGLLSRAAESELFITNLERLVCDPSLRAVMGERAAAHVRMNHNLDRNYDLLWQRLQQVL